MMAIVLRVMRLAGFVDDGVESVVLVSGVLDGADGAVGVVDGVFSLDHITVPGFPLVLEVTGVGIVNSIVVVVLGVGL
jgi:hypothetical protein